MYPYAVASLFAATLLLAAIVVGVFRIRWRSPSTLRTLGINASLLFFSLVFTLLSLEVAAYKLIIFPDGFNISLASKRWFERYWHPINSLGVRGLEPDFERFKADNSLLFLGDSFTAGSGLNDYRDRFSEQVKAKVGGRRVVETLAKGGWDTDTELQNLREFPVKPKRIVYQYYLNDIAHAARAAGVFSGVEIKKLPFPLQWLSDHSYLANFVHLQLFRVTQLLHDVTYWDNMRSYYNDPAIWSEHEAAIKAIVDYCRVNQIELGALIFPNLLAIEESRPITTKVKGVLESLSVPTVDLTDHFADRDPATLVLNLTNSHPNAPTHHEVADILIQQLNL